MKNSGVIAIEKERERRALAKIINELGLLERRLFDYDRLNKRADELRTELRIWAEAHEAARPVTLEVDGAQWIVQLSPKTMKRRIRSMVKLYAALGKAKFIEICSVALTALEDAIGKEAAAKHFVEERTGSRRVTLISRADVIEVEKAA